MPRDQDTIQKDRGGLTHPVNRGALPAVFFTLLFASLAWAADFAGGVVGVTEGDTIRVPRAGREVKVRLHGVDSPRSANPLARGRRRLRRTSPSERR